MIATRKKKSWTVTELGAAIGVDDRQLYRWFVRGCPKTSPEAVQKWRAKNVKQQPAERESGEPTQKALLEEQIRKLKLQNDRLEGELVHRDEVEQSAAEMVLRIKARLEAIPDEMEMELPSEGRVYHKRRIADKIRAVLSEMSQWEIDASRP